MSKMRIGLAGSLAAVTAAATLGATLIPGTGQAGGTRARNDRQTPAAPVTQVSPCEGSMPGIPTGCWVS